MFYTLWDKAKNEELKSQDMKHLQEIRIWILTSFWSSHITLMDISYSSRNVGYLLVLICILICWVTTESVM